MRSLRTRYPKDRFYWYQAWYAPEVPMIHIFPHWNGPDGAPVWVYSAVDAVELFVNGVSQGTKYMERFSHLEWGPVPWVAGRLAAVGYMTGSSTPVATAMVNTTGPPAALRARASWTASAGACCSRAAAMRRW